MARKRRPWINPVDAPSIIKFLDAYPSDEAARLYFERERWGGEVQCVKCGCEGHEITTRRGVYQCFADGCRKQFTVRVGTIMESSKVGYRKWLLAMYLSHVHRKGISSHQLALEIGVTQKTAWFMGRRIRAACSEAMDDSALDGPVQMDEAYLGGNEMNKHADDKLLAGRGAVGKQAVMGARGKDGRVKAEAVANADGRTAAKFISQHVATGSAIHTDESAIYAHVGGMLHQHGTVNHSQGVYAKDGISTNAIESFWAIVKRAYHGTHHWWSRKHSQCYLNESAFRVGLARMEVPGMERLRMLAHGAFSARN